MANGATDPPTKRTVRVFVSSTFRDMHAERDHLVTVVFPELRERLGRLGLEFYDVDLRWGVPEQRIDGEIINSWAYCKQWIDRVEPLFIGVLGERYGWVPCTENMEGSDEAQWVGLSITEMEIRHAVLERNEGNRKSYFYIREPQVPPPPATKEETYRTFVDHEYQQNVRKLRNALDASGRPVRRYPCKWTGQGFTDLDAFGRVVLEDLWSGVLRDPQYVPDSAWRQVLGVDPNHDPVFINESAPIPERLWARLVEAARPVPEDPRRIESHQMEMFGASRLRWFTGRQSELSQILKFVAEDLPERANRVLIVKGAAGQGKSALLARASQQLLKSNADVIIHHVGATPDSSDIHSVLLRIHRELDLRDIHRLETPVREIDNVASLSATLTARLRSYAEPQRLVLVLDGVDQLTPSDAAAWLPSRLGPTLRVVLSCIESPSGSDKRGNVPAQLRKREPAPSWIDLRPLDQRSVRSIVVEYFQEYCKELDKELLDMICRMKHAGNPLYLFVMLRELRTLGGDDMNRRLPRILEVMEDEHPDLISLFDWMLERLEVFGRREVSHWCGYLALGRAGFSSSELRELLRRKLGTAAGAVAARIERGLRPYLGSTGSRLDFFHGQLRTAVRERYLAEGQGAPSVQRSLHSDIAEYFAPRWAGGETHAISELPFHATMAADWERTTEVLTDLAFVQQKVSVGMTHQLLADYELAASSIPNSAVTRHQHGWGRYKATLVAYAGEWSQWRDDGAIPDRMPTVQLPQPPRSIETLANRSSSKKNHNAPPGSPERLSGFQEFVRREAPFLVELKGFPDFAIQHAYNYAPGGYVRTAAAQLIRQREDRTSLLLVDDLHPENQHRDQPSSLELQGFAGHRGFVGALALSADGDTLASVSGDRTVTVTNIANGSIKHRFEWQEGGSSYGQSVALSADGVVCAVGNIDLPTRKSTGLRVYELVGTPHRTVLPAQGGWVVAVRLTPDGRLALTGANNSTLALWDVKTATCLSMVDLAGTPNVVDKIELTADGRRAVVACGSVLRVIDLQTTRVEAELAAHADEVTALAAGSNGRYLVSASRDHTLRVWDLTASIEVTVLNVAGESIKLVSMTPDARTVAAWASGRAVSLWDIEAQRCVREIEVSDEQVTALQITPDGRRVVTGHNEGAVNLWSTERSDRSREPAAPDIVEGEDGSAIRYNKDLLIELPSGIHPEDFGTLMLELQLHPFVVARLENRIVVEGTNLTFWNLSTGQCYARVAPPTYKKKVGADVVGAPAPWAWVHPVPTKERLVAVSNLFEVPYVVDVASGVVELRIGSRRQAAGRDDKNEIAGIALSPDGRYLGIAYRDGRIVVVDLATGHELELRSNGRHEYATHGIRHRMSFSPDCRRLVAPCRQFGIGVWDLQTKEVVSVLDGHERAISSVTFTHDGKRLISCAALSKSHDYQWCIWDLERAALLGQVTVSSGSFLPRGALLPNGVFLVAHVGDNRAMCLDTSTGQSMGTLPVGRPVLWVELYDGLLGVVDLNRNRTVFALPDWKHLASAITVGRRYVFASGTWGPLISVCGWCGNEWCVDTVGLPAIQTAAELPIECPSCHRRFLVNSFVGDHGPLSG